MESMIIAENESRYISKMKSVNNFVGGGNLIFFALFNPIFVISFLWQNMGFIGVYLICWIIYLTISPFSYLFIQHHGLNVWMNWDVNLLKLRPLYYLIFGAIIFIIMMILSLSYLFGFDSKIAMSGSSIVLGLCIGLSLVYFFENHQKRENASKRFIMIRGKKQFVEDIMRNALESLGMKSSRTWIGSKWTGYDANRITDHLIHYTITPGIRISVIDIKPETADSVSKEREIEKAISMKLEVV